MCALILIYFRVDRISRTAALARTPLGVFLHSPFRIAFMAASSCACALAQLDSGTCIAICPIPTVDGDMVRYATYLQTILCALSLLFVEKAPPRRHAYYVLMASSLATILPIFVGGTEPHGGGFVTGYHALLVTYLMSGTLVCSAIALTTRQFFHRSAYNAFAFLLQVAVLGVILVYLSIKGLQAQFGSQPACNESAGSLNGLTVAELAFVLGTPWLFALVFVVKRDRPEGNTSGRHKVHSSNKMFWVPVATALIAIWITLTEKFVSSQPNPVLNAGIGTHRAFVLNARVFALLWVSFHILFRNLLFDTDDTDDSN